MLRPLTAAREAAALETAWATAEFLACAAARYPARQVDFGLHGENGGPRSVLEHAGWTLAEECRVCVRSLAGASLPARPKTWSPSRPEPFPNFPGCTTGRRACTGTAPGRGRRISGKTRPGG